MTPTDWEDREVVRITKEMRESFSEFVKERRVEHKATYGRGCQWDDVWKVIINGVGLKAYFFQLLLDAMDEIGTDEIRLNGNKPLADVNACVLAQ